MGNILLTSDGLSNDLLKAAFLSVLPEPIESAHVLFVPTAAQTEASLARAALWRETLEGMGFLAVNYG